MKKRSQRVLCNFLPSLDCTNGFHIQSSSPRLTRDRLSDVSSWGWKTPARVKQNHAECLSSSYHPEVMDGRPFFGLLVTRSQRPIPQTSKPNVSWRRQRQELGRLLCRFLFIFHSLTLFCAFLCLFLISNRECEIDFARRGSGGLGFTFRRTLQSGCEILLSSSISSVINKNKKLKPNQRDERRRRPESHFRTGWINKTRTVNESINFPPL